MIITRPGKVTETILLLGRYESCVYLVQGEQESVLLGGGMAHIVPDLLDQIAAFKINEQQISRICILHAHFDHCGAVPFLKKRWPWAKVTASARARELLSKPHIVQSIAAMNQKAVSHAGLDRTLQSPGFQFDGIEVEETVGEGDVLPVGRAALEVLEVPGHSSCSLALYMSSENALFASDALGLKHKKAYQPTPNSNFDHYQQSLEKMARYHPDVLLLEHFGAFLDEDARAFIPNAIEAAAKTRRLIEETYQRTRDIGKCIQEITSIFMKRSADAFLPDEVRAMVAGQMVRYIAKSMEQRLS